MSDVESSSAARKRARSGSPVAAPNGHASEVDEDIGPAVPAAGADDSDDEIGPMPVAAEEGVVVSTGRRKKRAGVS